jgi:hypothetical protein
MSIGLKGNVDGSGAIQVGGSDAISISTGLNATFAGTVTTPTGTLYPLASGTAVSASGTSVDFTGIPSTAKRVTVMFNGLSTNGTSGILFQVGTSGGVTTSGYSGGGTQLSNNATLTSTAGVPLRQVAAAQSTSGLIVWAAVGSNTWVASYSSGSTDVAAVAAGGGGVTLSGALDRIRVTSINGTDTFDAGTINIMWE